MNIAEIYYKYNKQLIILISGLSGTNKKKISEKLKSSFKCESFNLDEYVLKDFNKEVSLGNSGIKIIDWDDIESYDWKLFNKDINSSSKNIIVYGSYFPENKLDFKPDIQIHLKIAKQKLVENRHKYMEEHLDKFKDHEKIINTPNELYIVNNILFPHYLKYLEESKINKYINITEITEEQVYIQTFDYIIYFINKFIEDNIDKITKFLDDEKIPLASKN